MSKKILSVVIALVMVLSLSTVAFAADQAHYEDDLNNTQTWVLGDPVENAGTYTIPVSLTTNYLTGAVQFEVVLTGDLAFTGAVKGAAYPYDCNVSSSATTKKVMIVPITAGQELISSAQIDGVIANITVTGTNGTVTLKNDAKGQDNKLGTLVAARVDGSNLCTAESIVGQTVVSINTVTIGSTADPKLVVLDGAAGVIDKDYTEWVKEDGSTVEITGYIYGVEVVDIGESIEDVFGVDDESVGYLSIEANEAGYDNGTGAVVNVCRTSDDEIVETYVFILFGDIDGDGELTTLDMAMMDEHDSYVYADDEQGEPGRIDDTVMLFAGDIDFDGEVSTLDMGIVDEHDSYAFADEDGDGRITQAEIIANK